MWSLSSAKPGFGADQLRDNDFDTYWQSDGVQPHFINIQLPKKQFVSQLHIYLLHSKDESYTPSRIVVRVGSSFHDLVDTKEEVFAEPPEGWTVIRLADSEGNPIHTSFVQIGIMSMHQNGRDTHVRQVLIFGPRLPLARMMGWPEFKSSRLNRHLVLH